MLTFAPATRQRSERWFAFRKKIAATLKSHCAADADERIFHLQMVWMAITVGALLALLIVMRVIVRRTSHSMGRLAQLGTVSRQWLHVHRAADQ
jgi:hypothetical protein